MKKAAFLLITFATLVSFGSQTFGQDIRNTENSVDNGKRSSLTVDPITQALQLHIPLGSYKQRNGGDLPVALNYSSKVWQIKPWISSNNPMTWCSDDPYYIYTAEYSQRAGWSSTAGGIGIGLTYDHYNNAQQPANTGITKTVARMFVGLPDGSRHELRKDDTVYSGMITSFTGKYYSVDSSRLIYDTSNSTLYLPDGSRYSVGTYTDSQGNTMVHVPGTSVTDTLGRVIGDPGYLTTVEGDATYSLPGFGSGTVDYELHWRNLSDTGIISPDETDQTLKFKGNATGGCFPLLSGSDPLFPSDDVSGKLVLKGSTEVFDPEVLNQIELPNGQTYTFQYNVYGEIVKIIYPTGGYERFEYATVPSISGWFDDDFFARANRGVVDRWISPDGTSGSEVHYSYTHGGVTNPDGSSTAYSFYSAPNGEILSYGFDNPLYGKITEVREYSSASELMSRKLTEWTADGSVVTTSGKVAYKMKDPRVVREISVVFEPGSTNALASMTTNEYDSNSDPEYFAKLNVKRAKQYDYVAVNASTASSASLATATGWFWSLAPDVVNEFDYLYDSNYKARNMTSLVTETRVLDASNNVKAKTHITYDEVEPYPIIATGTNAQWTDPSTNYRGHPTTVRSWSDIAGNQYVDTHAQYDNFGNLRKAWDGNGNLTQTDYLSTYGYAYPTSVTTPIPDDNASDGINGSTTAFTSSTIYDFNTALPTSTTDINSQTTTMDYTDPATSATDALLRIHKVTAPNGQQTITEYGEGTSALTRWVKVKTQIDGSNWSEAVSTYDGIGRTVLTEKTDSNGNVFTETEYDENGRVKRSSNPYKTGETKKWTTPGYDNFGRTVSTTSPDSSVVRLSYGLSTSGTIGVTKTVTDQAGRKRKGITNARGQMIRVIEDPDSSALVTDYVFDLLGNLRQTTQGDQSRYFLYDALGRLLFAKQPEQDTNSALTATDPITSNSAWSAKYVYDANSNITTTTDARNQSIAATYDKLNRITLRDYSDSAMPDVSFYYDGTGLESVPAFAKGKTTKVTSSVSETRNTSFDQMGRLLTSEQRTDGATYPFEYTYNLSGALIEEKYPSGRVVKNSLNTDGELERVESKKNATSGPFHTYASNFTYNTAGAVTKMQLGNGRWETASYDTDRLQVTQIGLGTTNSTQDLLKLEFKYNTPSTADNNGSMREQKITVPTVGSNAGFIATQAYTYDNLNRLESATETVSTTQTWKQTFTYDRYGNRRFNTSGSNTTTLGSCTQKVCNPLINTADNRLQEDQDADSVVDYDHDENGSLVKNAVGERFGYDAEGHQKEFFAASNNTSTPDATYQYDGDGRRVKKVVGTEVTIFVYDASAQLVAEYATTIASVEEAQVSYLTTDHLGSPRVITDKNGAVSSRKDFTAFGEAVNSPQRVSGTSGNGYDTPKVRQDYTGHEKDEESGLEFAQARYYNAVHGRFTSVDPLTASATIRDPQTFNRYSYALNSPYKFSDPLGLYVKRLNDYCGGRGCRPPDSGVYFTSENVSDIVARRTRTTYTITQTELDKNRTITQQATITVTRDALELVNIQTNEVLESRVEYSRSAVNSGVGGFSIDELRNMAIVAERIVDVGWEKSRDVTLFLAMAQRETHLGIGTVGDPNNKGRPEMDQMDNPLQLDGDANKKYKAIVGDWRHNITYSMKLFDEEWPRSKSVSEKLGHYNDGGNIGSKGKSYATDILRKQAAIRVTTY